MPLELIYGPPGSGRVVAILEGFVAAIDADPVLVVATRDDVDRLERELCERRGGILGGTVTSLPGLFQEVRRAVGTDGLGEGELLSRTQRIWLARAAAASTPLRRLRGSARHAGFAPALERLLSDLQASGHDATSFGATVRGASERLGDVTYELELAALFDSYERHRDGCRRTDAHQRAARTTAALRKRPQAWRGRPVFLYGFDDLNHEQVELLAALAEAAQVTAAITFEDRPALAARADLLSTLRDRIGGQVVEERSIEDGGGTRTSSTLRHLERHLFEPDAPTIEPDGSLHLLEGAGERSTIELIARRIAQLLATGTDPDEIAVVVRNPDASAAAIVRAFAQLGIPAAAEARIPLANTATGAALDELLAIAAGEGTAETVVALLRRPARARPDDVDWLERTVLRSRLQTAEQALEAWAERERSHRIHALDWLSEKGDDPAAIAAVISEFAADVAEQVRAREAFVPTGAESVELRAASVATTALAALAELGDLAPREPAELRELLTQLSVPLWRGPTEGRVRILNPYRLRGTRVSHLFVAGLADGVFPAPGTSDPLLSDERRRRLDLPARSDPAAEERYLFYVCTAKPEVELSLAYPAADEDGRALARSPFVDEVRGLLSPPPTPEAADDPLEARLAERAGPTDFVATPGRACSERDLARALAAAGAPEESLRTMLRSADEAANGEAERAADSTTVAASALRRVLAAREQLERAHEPGPITDPHVLAALGSIEAFGASTLEGYGLCSYRWFVSHELKPRDIKPDPEPLETGGIIHEAFERLYREGPAGTRGPRPENVRRWTTRAHELLREVGEERGWDLDSAPARIALARLDAVIERFLRRDAELDTPLQPDPDLLEARFGDEEGAQFPAADFGEFRLRGAIDRIDTDGEHALIRDYKLSASAVPVANFQKEGRLQIPLYMAAARQFGLNPVGGLYSPLAATQEKACRPRGLLAKEHKGSLIPGEGEHHVSTDFLDHEEFEEQIEAGRQAATKIVRSIRAGRITRDPRDGTCPSFCRFAPICRMERALPDPDEEEKGEL